MHRQRLITGVGAAAAALILLSACGDDSGAEEPTTTPSAAESSPSAGDPSSDPASGTSCDAVWVEGADLPRGYDGCVSGTTAVAPEIVECSSGQRIVIYDDHYWALRGHVIGYAPQGLGDDKHYARVLYSCRA